jgi:hypothetical protein
MVKRILMSMSIIAIGLMVWFTGSFLLDAVSVGPNPMYGFSPNYIMVNNSLYYYPDPPDWDNAEIPLNDYISSFYVKNNWLLGKTDKGYFAINMSSHETFYPISTVEVLTEKTGIQISSEDWVDDRGEKWNSKYLRRNPAIIKFGKIVNAVFLFLFCGLCIGLFFWIKNAHVPHKHK